VSGAGGRDRCSGCQHPQAADLDAALVSGTSIRHLAKRFGLSTSAVHRHKAHVSASLVRVGPAAIISNGSNGSAPASPGDVLASLQRLYHVCSDALEVASQSGNMLQLALASRELRAALEVIGRQIERIEDRRGAPVIDLFHTPDYIAARTVIMEVMSRFPEAKKALVDRLRDVNLDA
jgi:hypothetical protein